jgi:2-keto-3-deoxy-L-fuconate dehydrogenase
LNRSRDISRGGKIFSLKDMTAVVTGAGSGIGEAIARSFAEAGARVWIFERDEAAGRRVAAAIGSSARFVACDVAEETSVKAAAAQVQDGNQAVHVVVNNAGIGHVGTALTTKAADLNRLWRVNTIGTLLVTQVFLPGMIERRRGSVINLASIGGVTGLKDRLAYCASKHATVGLTRCMALDHAESGVRFNAICPGRVETPFVAARIKEYPDPERAYREMSSTQALGRMGTPAEIAAAAVYLASDEAAFVTGTALVIDGGFSAGK